VAERARERALETAGLLHPAPEAVTAAVFVERPEFFAAFDKVQVKYEMLRAHLVEGESVTAAAAAHGYSRASFYLVARAFEEAGMVGRWECGCIGGRSSARCVRRASGGE